MANEDEGKTEVASTEAAPDPEPAPAASTVVDLPEVPAAQVRKMDEALEDSFRSAVKMAFVGAGQGGGRIAETFYQLGYRRVCAVNTTQQDLEALSVPHKLVIGKDKGGAGKDPAAGERAARQSLEDVVDVLKRAWGDGPEQMFVCVGGGGGSGTGSWPVILEAMREYSRISNIEGPVAQHLGMILTLPKRSEGPRVQKNALGALEGAIAMLGAGDLSTLVVVDNAKVHELFPGEPVKSFWSVANNSFARVLHTFNLLAAQNSEHVTFDRADFRSVLRSGMLLFGMAAVDRWRGTDDISQAVRQNLKGSLLGEGFDLSKATTAAAIVVADGSVLAEVPMQNLDYAFHALTRALGNEALTLHSGIYEGRQPGMRILTVVGGLQPPADRLEELRRLGK